MQIKSSTNEAKIKQPAPLSSHQHKHTAQQRSKKTESHRAVLQRRLSHQQRRPSAAADLPRRVRGRRGAGTARAAPAAGRAPGRAGGSRRGSPLAFPRPAEGGRRPPHLEEVILVHHAAVGQGLHQPASQGGLAAVGHPAARRHRPSATAAGHVRALPAPPRSRRCGTRRAGWGKGSAPGPSAPIAPRAGLPTPPVPGPPRLSHPPMPMMMFMAPPAAARPDSYSPFLRGGGGWGGLGTRRLRYRPPTCLSREPGKGGREGLEKEEKVERGETQRQLPGNAMVAAGGSSSRAGPRRTRALRKGRLVPAACAFPSRSCAPIGQLPPPPQPMESARRRLLGRTRSLTSDRVTAQLLGGAHWLSP